MLKRLYFRNWCYSHPIYKINNMIVMTCLYLFILLPPVSPCPPRHANVVDALAVIHARWLMANQISKTVTLQSTCNNGVFEGLQCLRICVEMIFSVTKCKWTALVNNLNWHYRIYPCISRPFKTSKSVQKFALDLYMGQNLRSKRQSNN